uniref:Tumor necrosis factor alpha-induced protein 2 n=1 Tax=Oryzias sinensis TaxID=183150 RepID=A0A8C7Y082_9TELE
MGRQLREDLLLVVRRVKACYPPEAKICHFYATLYHQTLSTALRDIVDFVLDDQDCSFILRWVNEYFPGIFENPELAGEIDVAALGELLPEMSLQCLEVQHLSKQQVTAVHASEGVGSDRLRDSMAFLEEEVKQWDQGAEPSTEEGRCVSHLAYDVIQVRPQYKATVFRELCTGDSVPVEMKLLVCKAFVPLPHTATVPEAGNQRLAEKERLSEAAGHIGKRAAAVPGCAPHLPAGTLFCPLTSFSKAWTNTKLMQVLLIQELIGRLHQEVTEEYVRRVLRGDLRLKAREQQEMACAVMINNAETDDAVSSQGSKEVWLEEILIKIAEVLKLQDVPAIQVQVVSLGSTYPDLREAQVSTLLKLKANLSKAHRKTIKATLSDALKEGIPGTESHPFFSNI